MSESFVVAAFYHFARMDDLEEYRHRLLAEMQRKAVRGTVLLAEEGINGTVAGSREGVDAVLSLIRSDGRFSALLHKEATTDEMPFRRTKVRLKKEIVSLGVPGVDPTERVGEYVPPSEWNDLIEQPDVLLVDTRNSYEYRMGTFDGAVDPETQSFRDFPEYVASNLDPARHRRVAMFCTGGIRCEKATSYMLEQGFEEVYHLQGGILKYLEEVPEEGSRWKGECFVFDDRVGVDHRLQPGNYVLCHACRMPLAPEELGHPHFEEGVSCPNCHADRTEEDRERYRERERQMLLAEARGVQHLGDTTQTGD